MLVLLRTLAGRDREAMLRSYAEAVDAIGTIVMPDRPYGQILGDQPITAGTWRDYLRLSLDRFIALNGAAIAAMRGDLDALRTKALDRLGGVAASPPKALVHGDYFPGNVLIGDDLRVSGLVDFSFWTVAGDAMLDIVGAAIFLEMNDEATAEDIAFVRALIIERHGDAALAAGAVLSRLFRLRHGRSAKLGGGLSEAVSVEPRQSVEARRGELGILDHSLSV